MAAASSYDIGAHLKRVLRLRVAPSHHHTEADKRQKVHVDGWPVGHDEVNQFP